MIQSKKIAGIIGGVGPSATVDLYRLITMLTPARIDQQHIHVLIDSYPQIPDRTEAILEDGASPVPYMVKSAQLLEKMGADFLAIPCNTAHYFLPEVAGCVSIPFINMIEETGKALARVGIKRVGLLSTSGTARSRIYQETLRKQGIEVFVPRGTSIRLEMEAIYGKEGIKAGAAFEKSERNKKLFKEVIAELEKKSVEAIIMGCTEIPLCLGKNDSILPLINPTEILARAIIEKARSS